MKYLKRMPIANKNIKHLIRSFDGGKRGVVLEGSSRSGKTWSGVDFILYLTSTAKYPIIISIVKETYASFKTTIFDDINKRFPMANIVSPLQYVNYCTSFRLFGSKINFMGADQPSKYHGAGCDFFWINESLDVDKSIFDQLEMRCRKFWWMDYNPKCSTHWIYELEKRNDVSFLRTTIIDNPNISHWEKKKILSYDPNNPENVEAGTADDYMWTVYGLGLRASPTGLVYPNVTWIDTFPDDLDQIVYGLDFGYTHNPSALVKVGKSGMNLYLQLQLYEPIDNPQKMSEMVKPIVGDRRIWADSADPLTISDLRRRGVKIYPCVKKEGSVIWGIGRMKEYKIHIVNSVDFKKEQENYKWMEIHGIRLNEPVKAFDHAWDAARYATTMEWPAGR